MLLNYIKAAHGGTVSRQVVDEVVRQWIAHRFPGEPPLLTRSRQAYVKHHLARCLAAMELVPEPDKRGRLLELGSGIYLMTFLLQRLCNYDTDLVQYWGKPSGEYRSILTHADTGERCIMPFREFNAEREPFPYPDACYDVIVNCEAIEHLLCNPVHMLAECHRVLKQGGTMIITTPNVLRIDNVVRLLRGNNIYDKYTLESPSARHPREYTPEELRALLEWVGFDVTHLETRDVNAVNGGAWARRLARLCAGAFHVAGRVAGRHRAAPRAWRGEQIFLVARRIRDVNRSAPDFLFEAPADSGKIIDALYAGGRDS